MWLLGIELRTSKRAVSALNLWTISPVPACWKCTHKLDIWNSGIQLAPWAIIHKEAWWGYDSKLSKPGAWWDHSISGHLSHFLYPKGSNDSILFKLFVIAEFSIGLMLEERTLQETQQCKWGLQSPCISSNAIKKHRSKWKKPHPHPETLSAKPISSAKHMILPEVCGSPYPPQISTTSQGPHIQMPGNMGGMGDTSHSKQFS